MNPHSSVSRGTRIPEEEAARNQCRALTRRLGSRIHKRDGVAKAEECRIWPSGLMTAFNGWVDLHKRLVRCEENPELITDGVYVQETSDAD